jgi:hypothetical protein
MHTHECMYCMENLCSFKTALASGSFDIPMKSRQDLNFRFIFAKRCQCMYIYINDFTFDLNSVKSQIGISGEDGGSFKLI